MPVRDRTKEAEEFREHLASEETEDERRSRIQAKHLDVISIANGVMIQRLCRAILWSDHSDSFVRPD